MTENITDLRKGATGPFYFLHFQMIRKGRTFNNYYKIDNLVNTDKVIRGLLLYFLKQSIKQFKLYDEAERQKNNWCLNFNEIFTYDIQNDKLCIINPNYELDDVCDLTHAKFLNRELKYNVSFFDAYDGTDKCPDCHGEKCAENVN
jgi:hypothetical protein